MKISTLPIILILMLLLMWGCSNDENPAEVPIDSLSKLTCAECHTDQVALQTLATEEPDLNGESGEG